MEPMARMKLTHETLVDNFVIQGCVYEQDQVGRNPAFSVRLWSSADPEIVHSLVVVGDLDYLRSIAEQVAQAVDTAAKALLSF